MNKFTGLFIILSAASIVKSCENIQKFDPQLFQNISNDIHDTLSRVFGELQLPDRLQEADRFSLLWIMHNNLNSIAQNYFKIYIDIVNASKVVNKTVNSLTTLNKVIEEMAQEENDATVYNRTDPFNLTGHMASHEASMMFISNFTMKFDNSSLDDILKKAIHISSYKRKRKILKRKKINRYRRKYRRNLQLWLPRYSSIEENENLTRRMSQSTDTVLKHFAFIASIHALGEFVCSGAILSDVDVITAASCLHFVYQSQKILHDNKSLKCRVGTEYPDKSGLTVSAIKVIFHPSYDPMTLENNLAIIKLKWSLNFKHSYSKNVMRVNYGKVEGALQRNLNAIIMIGWGDKNSIPQKDHLSVTSMDIVELKKCRSIYTEKYVTSNNFCGAILKRSPQGPATCQRDIGSPAMIGNLLVGLVSYGPSVCAPPSAPTVYTDLATYVDWINNTIVKKHRQSPSTFNSVVTTNPPFVTTASIKTTTTAIFFRQSPYIDEVQIIKDLKAQISAKSKNIVELRNSYPKAVKFLSFLLNQIVDMRTVNKEKPKKKSENFEPETVSVTAGILSSEDDYKRPERNDYEYLRDDDPEATTAITTTKEYIYISNENHNSEQIDTEDFSLTQDEGLSISIEPTEKSTVTRPKTTTVSKTRPQKSSKTKDTKSNKNKNSKAASRSKKKIKNFKDLQQVLEKEVIAKQEERLRYQKETKEEEQKNQKQEEEESEEEEVTKDEIEKIIEEVKHKKKKKSSGPISSVLKDDKTATIRKMIEEILSQKEKSKASNTKLSKKIPKEKQASNNLLNYNVNTEDESSEENEETEAENVETITVTNKVLTSKSKTKKKTAENKKTVEKIKHSSETEIETEVKKKIKHTVHKQISSNTKATKLQTTKLAAEKVLDKNFMSVVSKKGSKLKSTTPHPVHIKTKSSKTTQKRSFAFKASGKPATKHIDPLDENVSTDKIDSVEGWNSASSKEITFLRPQQLKKANAMLSLSDFDSDDESPMFLPPAMADFEIVTKDRLIRTPHPNLIVLEPDIVVGDDISFNNVKKLPVKGSMTIDDVNINMGIPEEWSFRRVMTSNDSSLEKFIKVESKQSTI